MLELDFLAAVFGLFTLIKIVVYPKKNFDEFHYWKIGAYLKTKEKNLMSCIIRTALDSFIKSSARLLVLLKCVVRLKVIE